MASFSKRSAGAGAMLGAAILAIASTASAQQPYPYPYPYPPPPVYAPPPVVYAPPPALPPQAPWQVENWDADAPAPAGYNKVVHANGRLIGMGIGLLAMGWGVSAVTGAVAQASVDPESSRSGGAYSPLYVPVAGPFFALGTLRPRAAGTGLLLMDGIVQGAGLLGIVAGIIDQRATLVRVDPNAATPDGGFATSRSPAASGLRLGGTILAGLGGATLLASGITWLVAAGDRLELNHECPDHVCVEGTRGASALRTARDAQTGAEVTFGIGAPLLGAGVSLLMLSAGLGGHRVSMTPIVDGQNKGAMLHGSF